MPNKDSLKYRVNYSLILFAAFLLPLHKSLIAPVISLLFLSSLWNFDRAWSKKLGLLLLTPYLLWLGVGLLWTENKDVGLFELELNLGFLAFPIIFIFSKISFKETLDKVILFFIEGVILAMLLGIINSVVNYVYKGDPLTFFYGNVSVFHHTSYAAMYCSFAVAMLYYWSFHPKKSSYIYPTLSFICITTLSIYALLLMSKTGIVLMAGIHLFSITYWILKHKKYILGAVSLLSILAIVVVSFVYVDSLRDRFLDVVNILGADGTSETSSGSRLISWKGSWELFLEHPITGVGTGDVNQELNGYFVRSGHNALALKSMNSHNQFLQTLLKLGTLGFLSFLWLFIINFKNAQKKKAVYLIFSTLFLLNCLTESMLQIQSGIVFFSFFNSLFLAYFLERQKASKTVTLNLN